MPLPTLGCDSLFYSKTYEFSHKTQIIICKMTKYYSTKLIKSEI